MSTEVASTASTDASTPGHDNHNRTRRLISGAVVVAFAVPTVAYFWFIHHYAVNTIWGDQWADVDVLKHVYSGSLGLGTLWTQHNEERNLFSNLIAVAVAETTHFNVVAEMYVSAVLLAAAASLFIVTHKSRSASTPMIVYVPVVLVLLTFAEYSNTLWGFQVAWYIVLVALATALLLLDRPALSGLAFAGAIVAAVVGSFSLLQGLFIWPAGLVVLVQRRRSVRNVALWIAAAVITTTVYFYDFNFNGPGTTSGTYARHHAGTTIKFFFVAIGRVVGTFDTTKLLLIGIGVFVVALWLVITGGIHPDEASARPLGVALILFGMLFALSVSIARSHLGMWPARSPEYITMDMLILVGCYFIVTSREPRRVEETGNEKRGALATAARVVAPAIAVLVIGVIAVQVVGGYDDGVSGAQGWHFTMTRDEHVLAGINEASDHLVINSLVYDPQFVRQMALVAKKQRLSMFSTSTAQQLNTHSPYYVAVSNLSLEKSVGGASASAQPKYPQDVTLMPTVGQACVRLSTGRMQVIGLPTPQSPGSVPASVSHDSTVEVLFFTTPPNHPITQSILATAVDFVTVKPADSWVNIPGSSYAAVYVEGTSGVTRLCPSAT